MISHIFKLIWNKKGSNALVLLEIFLAFLILFAVLSFVYYNTDRLKKPLGFETENRKYVRFGSLSHLDSAEYIQTIQLLKSSLEDLDLVKEVGMSHQVGPYANSSWCTGTDANGFNIRACYCIMDEDFIPANDVKLVAGRNFSEEDLTATYPPMIPNQFFIDKYFEGKDMIDSVLVFNGTERRIVGIAEAFKYQGEFSEEKSEMLLYYDPANSNRIRLASAYLHMDPSADVAYEEEISKTVESVLRTTSFVIQDAPIMRKRKNLETWLPMVALLAICGFLCLNVALGLFGVLSYAISKRKAEVGLRRALGAHAGLITRQFVLEIVLLALIAIGIGTFFAIQVPLLQVMDVDQTIFYRGIGTAAVIILSIVTLCALYPSLQASRIHPATALHQD